MRGEFALEKTVIKKFELDKCNIAVIPKVVLRNFIVGRSLRCVLCFILAGLMIVPLTILPGLAVLVLPAEIAVLGKIHDEAQLIQWVRHHTIVREGKWEETESEKDMAFLKAPTRRDSTVGYIR